jgi:hypothetical protein
MEIEALTRNGEMRERERERERGREGGREGEEKMRLLRRGSCSSYGSFHHSLNHRKVRIHVQTGNNAHFRNTRLP